MPTMSLSVKKCVHCQKDVTYEPRMKDSSGRYWCVLCGTADQQKKAAKKRSSSSGSSEASKGTGGGIDRSRLIKMLVFMGLLAAGAVWRLSTMHG